MKLNVELLEKVKAAILAEPERFDMNDWTTRGGCQTAHCIGGWIQSFLHEERKEFVSIHKAAFALIDNHDAQDRLFYVVGWPEPYKTQYLTLCIDNSWHPREGNHAAAAKIAAERIDHFIKTEGRE